MLQWFRAEHTVRNSGGCAADIALASLVLRRQDRRLVARVVHLIVKYDFGQLTGQIDVNCGQIENIQLMLY